MNLLNSRIDFDYLLHFDEDQPEIGIERDKFKCKLNCVFFFDIDNLNINIYLHRQ